MEGASQADNDVEGHSGTVYGEKVQLWKLLWSWPQTIALRKKIMTHNWFFGGG